MKRYHCVSGYMDDSENYELGETIEGIGPVVSVEEETMYLTTSHSASSYGIPVFLDGDGRPMDYAPAIQQLRKEKGWGVADLAEQCGVSARTVEGWEQGRMPSKPALIILSKIL